MEPPQAKQSKKIVSNVPKKGIKNALESTVSEDSLTDEMRKLSVAATNEEHRQNNLRVSSIGIPARCLKRKLLVLDINGLLADIVSPPPKQYKADKIIRGKAG